MKKIIFGNKELPVINVYPYMYTNGKVVLRVSASEENVTEADLKLLQANTDVIDYYELENEEWVKKITYENYTSGEYVSSYKDGVYSAEVTRIGETEKKVAELEEQNAMLTECVLEMSEVIYA